MSIQRTLAIIKPDAVAQGVTGRVMSRIEEAGFTIQAAKMIWMSDAQARGFYVVHKERPFYGSLATFMTQGPCLVMVLQRENAIQRWRDLMGATNPAYEAPGQIRKVFQPYIEAEDVHGSDSPESAAFEISFFFSALEVH